MGRLFWKFFLVILVSQLAATLIGGALMFLHRPPEFDWPEPSSSAVSQTRPGDARLPLDRPDAQGTRPQLPPLAEGPREQNSGIGPDDRPPFAQEDGRFGPPPGTLPDDRGPRVAPRGEGSGVQDAPPQPADRDRQGPASQALSTSPDMRPVLPARNPPPPGFFGPRGVPWIPFGVGFVSSLLFAALLARHFSRPIMALRKAFGAVAKGDFDIHPAAEIGSRHDELAELGHDFEHTAAQIKSLMGNQQRLLHDVSHEVRSPLARMQLAIDLARQQPEKTTASMERIERESVRINHLVGELLTLSRLEVGAHGALDEILDVTALVTEVVEDARFEAAAVHRDVHLESCAEVYVKGHAELLQRAVENVVRNAVRHTCENSTVQVSLHAEGRNLRICVDDDGPGVPEQALDAIFEPFVRFSEDRGNDGYGLGLAITRNTIEAHGGHVRAINRPHGGLRLEMTLPIAEGVTVGDDGTPLST